MRATESAVPVGSWPSSNAVTSATRWSPSGAQFVDSGALAAFDEHLHLAVRQRQELQDGGYGADLVQVGRTGVVRVGVAFGDQQYLLVVGGRRLDRAD